MNLFGHQELHIFYGSQRFDGTKEISISCVATSYDIDGPRMLFFLLKDRKDNSNDTYHMQRWSPTQRLISARLSQYNAKSDRCHPGAD